MSGDGQDADRNGWWKPERVQGEKLAGTGLGSWMVSFGPISLSLWAYRNLFPRNCLNYKCHWSWSVHKFGGHITSHLWIVSLMRTACYSLLWHLLAAAAAAAAKSLQLCLTLCNPHRWQPTRLPSPWDSPGKNTGVGCHFLLQCMKVKSESEVTQSCPTLGDPMDCSPPGFSIHGIFQARVLEWGAITFSIDMLIFNPVQLTP